MACTVAGGQSSARVGPISGRENVNYTRTVWRVSDGLLEDTVQALAESADGALWIGTTGGLANFDGAHIRSMRADLLRKVGVNSIFALLSDRDGSLWAGTEGGGLIHVRAGEEQVFSLKDGLTDGFVRALCKDEQGVLWVGTDDGLFQLRGERFARVDLGGDIPKMAVHSIAEDAQHRIWVGGSSLLSIAPDRNVTRYALPGSYSKTRVKKILQTRDGTVWVGTVGGLARLDATGFHNVGELKSTVRSLLETTDGTLWIGTIGEGVWTLHEGRLARAARPDLLPSETVLTMLQDDSGQVWLGTQAGLVRLEPTAVGLISLPKAGDPDFETLAGDMDGSVWVAAGRLYHIRGEKAEQVQLPGLNGVNIRNVFRARDDAFWVGTDGSGAYRIANGAVRHYSSPAELINNFPRAFMEARNGDLWIATDEGVTAIGPAGTRQYTQASGLAYFSTRCLLEDRDGAIWIGTDRGLSVWNNGHFENNTATRELAREKIWSLLQDSSGAMWFGTRDHGLFRMRNGRVESFSVDGGVPTNSIYQLLQDRSGIFWITGPNTIASADAAQMDGPAPTPTRPLKSTMYAMPFGAEGAQLYGGREPAGYVAPDDTVWFPTSLGVAHIIRTVAAVHGPPPQTSVIGVQEDGLAAKVESHLQIAAGTTRLSFEYGATDLRPRRDLHFRYRLDGFDRDWTSGAPSDVATYTNLKAGHYRFRVQALEGDRLENGGEAVVEMVKRPYFYQTWWFYALCLALAAFVTWGLYRLRLHRLHRQFAAVLEERNRMAREIHDTVLQGVTGVSAVLEAMAITSAADGEHTSELLDYAREQTQATIHEARRAVWDMRHEHDEDLDLMEALRGLASQTMREHSDVMVAVKGPGAFLLRTSALHEVMMVMREAVGNALQHSGSSRIELTVEVLTETIVARVADFGRGMEHTVAANPPSGHFGLIGMRERMKRIGGMFLLTTSPGTGTSIELRLPLSRSRKLDFSETA